MNAQTIEAWEKIDKGLETLMEANDELSDKELVAKNKRLIHLQKFVGRLAMRVSERLRENTNPGDIGELFDRYQAERSQIDAN
jgi:hypothetical protein